MKVTAAPGRHGPPLSSILVGDVIGFVLQWEGQQNGAVYISGDTVLYDDILQVGKKFQVGTYIPHLGAVQFPITLGIRYTFKGEEAATVAKQFKVKKVIPVHYEGWSHFRESKETSSQAFEKAGIADIVQWLTLGTSVILEV